MNPALPTLQTAGYSWFSLNIVHLQIKVYRSLAFQIA